MTQPQTETKLFAQFRTPFCTMGGDIEIKDVQEAVDYGTKNDMGSFRTYEVTSVIANDKVLTGGRENWSDASYLCVDKILTAADIASVYEERIKQRNASNGIGIDADGTPFNDENWAEIHAHRELYMRDRFKSEPQGTAYVSDYDGYNPLKPGSKVYNKQGRQIWPKPSAAPAPKKNHGLRR